MAYPQGDFSSSPESVAARMASESADRTPLQERPIDIPAQQVFIPPPLHETGLTGRLAVTTEYTDNLFLTSQDADNDKKDDVITFIAPGLHYVGRWPVAKVEADYQFQTAIYANNTNLNNVLNAQSLLVKADSDVGRDTQIELFEHYRYTRNPVNQIISGTNVIRPSRQRIDQNTFSTVASHWFTPKAAVRLGFSHLLARYEGSGLVDTMTYDGELGLRRLVTTRDRFDVVYRFRRYDYNGARNQSAHAAYVGYRRALNEKITIEGRIGVNNTESPRRYQPLGRLSLAVTSYKSILGIILEQDLLPVGFGLSGVFRQRSALGFWQTPLGQGVRGSIGLFYFENENLADSDVRFTVLSPVVSLIYAPKTWLFFRVAYSHIRLNDDSASEKFLANRIGLSVIASF